LEKRYLDHPITGIFFRKLIWSFNVKGKTVSAIWKENGFVDSENNSIKLDKKTEVEPWHPVLKSTEEVLGWRRWLEKHEVQQPFKQAHREVYILTDAERNTNDYSNRFAAHIINQFQCHALCGTRRWKSQLWMGGGDFYPPTKEIPKWDLVAEFFVEFMREENGEYVYFATDQVRFHTLSNEAMVSLEEIPPIVFSEIMRDVDLFVGVSSVGNDPEWNDEGRDRIHLIYWQNFSFGELAETAKTRKEILEKLVPRLKIADRCSFEERYLVVRGDIRTYKIHMGSSNILMEPEDSYLCIVPKPGKSRTELNKLFLPYEGDDRLSVILSKAFMLAEDTKITDSTIISQIGTKKKK
jgi:Domain of unknown function (DUF4132)